MNQASRTFTFRALAVGVCAMIFMGMWIQYHEVLAPSSNIIAENSPPAGAVGVFIGVLLIGALVSWAGRGMRLAKGEFLVVYTMLVVSAPLMSQGMWHRFLGLVVSIPRSQDNMPLVDSYSEKLWPHGAHILAQRRFEQGLGDGMTVKPAERGKIIDAPESQVGKVRALQLANPAADAPAGAEPALTEFRIRVPRERGGKEILVPGERYYVTGLFRLDGFKSQSSLSIELVSDAGTRAQAQTLRRDTSVAYSRPGGFQRAGEPYVVLPRDTKAHVDLLFTLTGPGTAAITDINFFSMEALARLHKGTSEIAAGNADKLDPNQRDGLLVRPDHLGSPAGIWYVLKGYIPWEQWWRPLLCWALIVMAMFLCLLGIGVVFRKQWAENERFAFPLVVLPRLLLEEKDDGGKVIRPLFRHKAFRGGVIAAVLYSVLLGLAYYLPGMPNPAVSVNLVEYFSSPAMRSFVTGMVSGNFQIILVFAAVAFFIELDMLLSILVMLWLCKVPYYLGEVFGWKTIRGPVDSYPFPHEQHIGAFLCLALLVFWVSRKHLLGVWRRVWRRPGGVDDSRETMSYRWALALIVGSFVFFGAWGVWTGLGWASALTLFGFLVVCGLAAARIRTECGAPATYFTPYYPYLLFFIMGGVEFFGTRTMLLTYMAGGFMAVAQFLMFAPSQVEMLHLADSEGCKPSGIKWALIAGALGGILIGGYVVMVWCYGKGGDNIQYMQGWGLGQNWYFGSLREGVLAADRQALNVAAEGTKSAYQGGPVVAVGIGIVVTLALTFLRTFFVGFWLHPIGYVLANTHFIAMCWGSLFSAWVVKWIALKVGGPRFIRDTMTPLFAGLFVGAVAGMLFWDIVALWRLALGIRDVYTCFP